MARTKAAAATNRGICHRESFDTNGIIADVAPVFAIALEYGSLLAVRRSAVKREQARWRKAAASCRTPERAGGWANEQKSRTMA
jgi:hypothetical protein